MPLHLGPRLHAFTHGLFKSSDAVEARELFDEVQAMLAVRGLLLPFGRQWVAYGFLVDLSGVFELPNVGERHLAMYKTIMRIMDFEDLFLLPDVDWSERRSISGYWEIRDYLARQKKFMKNFDRTYEMLREALFQWLGPIYDNFEDEPVMEEPDGITVASHLLHSIPNIGETVEHLLAVLNDEDLTEIDMFPRHSRNLNRNVIRASGGNPDDPKSYSRMPKLPSQYDAKDPAQLVTAYLDGTPLFDMFDQTINFTIPTKSRFEHHHLVAGTGHGKTQTLQYLIAQDLQAVMEGNRTVIVIDSQGDLIKNISNLEIFGPEGPLHDKITIIDPTDVDYPVSLNMFDVGVERLKNYDPLERERLTNSILELYDFVLGTLLDAGMTQKQNVIFRYVTRLMLHIPDATIHTLRELMEPGAEKIFADDIAKLTGSARRFFDTEFAGKEFVQTKQQVLRRLWGILENQTFERMFSHPRSKIDLYSEMNAGRVILINTAKDLLKEQGTQIFGRFFIALIAQAAQERATLPEHKRMPTMVYVDEAQDYFDRNIGIILAQARKFNVGMVLAHQFLGQLDPKLQEAFGANTSIKFAGGVSAKDARSMAPMLYCDAGLIESQPKGSFAAHIRGVTKGAVPLQFPFGVVEGLPQMTKEQRKMLQAKMRADYAVHHSELSQVLESGEDEPETEAASEQTKTEHPEPKKPPPGQVDIEPGDKW